MGKVTWLHANVSTEDFINGKNMDIVNNANYSIP